MAIYHLSGTIIGRSSGRSSVAAAAYRAGEKIKNELTGDVWDFTRKGGVVLSGIEAPEGVPDWVKNRAELWNQVERREDRVNSRFAREYNIALPSELTLEENKEMLKTFISEQFTKRGIVSDWAIHEPNKEGDSRNIHAHIMTTTRKVDRDGWTEKDRDSNRIEVLQEIRESWAKTVNQELERRGFAERIDHRTLEEQGIDREPQQHMGPKATAIERREEATERKRYASKERANEPPSQIKDTPPMIEESKDEKEAAKTIAAYKKIEAAIDNPEEWKKLKNTVAKSDSERLEKIDMRAAQKTINVQRENLENYCLDYKAKNKGNEQSAEYQNISKKVVEINRVLSDGDEKKFREYINQELRNNKMFNDEFLRQRIEADKSIKRDDSLDLIKKEMQEIERIREEERQRQREQERGRGR